MKELQKLLTNIRTKPHCLLPAYAHDFEQRIIKALDDNSFQDYDTTETPSVLNVQDGIAQIDINGIIAKRVGLPQAILDILGVCDLDNVDSQLKAAQADSNVRAVLLNVNSPGGYVEGLVTTSNLIKNMGKETAVWSDIQNCSAAYWLSSQADSIIISPEVEIGAVGVYSVYFNYADQLKAEGIGVTLVKSGTEKAIGNPYVPMTDADKALLQADTDALGAEFRATVNNQRDIDNQYLQGWSYRGTNAIKLGFADGIADSKEEVLANLK